MKKTIGYILLLMLPLLPAQSSAQIIVAADDFLTITLGQSFNYNVTDNDSISPGAFVHTYLSGDSLCFFLEPNGQLFFSGSPECCGQHFLTYYYDDCAGICSANVVITVLCKPDCYFVNLDDLPPSDNGGQQCANACENSEAIYYVPYNPGYTYTWSVSGGTFVPGSNPAEIRVSWGPKGNGTVLLTTVNSAGESVLKLVCVDILEGPVADFEAPNSVCLNEPVTFNNTSTGGDGFFWDFGDGQTSSMFAPTHEYTAPGTYTVCLVVTRQNYETNIPNENKNAPPNDNLKQQQPGDLLCCCTDTICMELVVEPLQAPNIYCISTLCANDNTEYWTDAANCSTYTWSVKDENGMPLAFSGQGTDRIAVQWGAGPTGTVSLYVEGCDDLYCADTVSVTVPILSATTTINGPATVCNEATATYTVQKWISAHYEWEVLNGEIISGQGTNTVTVFWFGAGNGSINVQYYSDFLGGLPGHDPADCTGAASLAVEVKPRFEIAGPALECIYSPTSLFASPGTNYTWSISPPATFSGQGTGAISVDWPNSGTFVVTAVPTDPTLYCNASASRAVEVIEVPKPIGINGPADICPGGTYTYTGQTSEAGVGFDWTVTGGTAAYYNSTSIEVTWDATGPYSLALKQSLLSTPYCFSEPFELTLTPKLLNSPVTIDGPIACINSLQNYSASPLQHPDATYTWSVTPAFLGSVANGQGTPDVQIQWNNDVGTADLTLTVELCGVALITTRTIEVFAPVAPVIAPTGPFCTGNPVTLDAGAGFTSYLWSVGGATTQTVTISANGDYSVTTTDANGCTASDSYEAVAGPVAKIVSPQTSVKLICLTNPASVTLTAQDGPGFSFEWFRDGISVGNSISFLHLNTNIIASFNYQVVVTDAFGCTATSDPVEIRQIDCSGSGGMGGTCTSQPFTLSFTAVNQTPECYVVDFTVSASPNVTLEGWDFDDPNNNANSGTLANAIHAYTTAGPHEVVLIATVPELSGPGFCLVGVVQTVNVPLVANFKSSFVCETVTFTDMSAISPISWSWSFGDGNTSNLQNPVHTYPGPGTYDVTLTVSDASGCQATVEKQVTAGGAPVPVITAAPSPYCVDKSILFSAAGPSIVSWFWDFSDMAENASPSPYHTYVATGSYNVTLTVTDARSCTNTAVFPLTVNPLPPDDVITAAPGLTVCDGATVTLTAPSGTGYTYLWSTSETTQSINVTTSGDYSVTVTGPDGCTMTPDAVTVVMLPLPSTVISGSHYICNSGCIQLRAPLGSAWSYQWYDASGPIAGSNLPFTSVCDYNLASPYTVQVTDGNTLCSATSAPFDVSVVSSPSFGVIITPDDCEGVPVTLQVNPIQPDVVYAWSNGATGFFTVVQQAGTYIAIGRDTVTGCQSSAAAIIYPQPDLCLVPVGCYEVCDPDTICGPDGLASYQWNMNGMPIPGETGQCLIVTQNGDYSLTGTTPDGCSLTTDTLRLETKNCNCVGMNVAINCPANIAVSAPGGSASAIVNYASPTATTDCTCPGIVLELTAGLPSGSAFPVGTTQVCYMATDSCGNTASCCFNVIVSGADTACDVKIIGCLKYELLTITQNTDLDRTYRIRVTNTCSSKLIYTAFQLPNGVTATAPADNTVYTASSGRQYQVRNPNFSPFYSIRWKSITPGMANGESDIFYYTLPAQAEPDYIHVTGRLENQLSYEAHINTFYCPVTPMPKPGQQAQAGSFLRIFPNPTSGTLYADLSTWKGEEVRIRILGASGQQVMDITLTADAAPQPVPLPEHLANGLYALDVIATDGERAIVRFVLER